MKKDVVENCKGHRYYFLLRWKGKFPPAGCWSVVFTERCTALWPRIKGQDHLSCRVRRDLIIKALVRPPGSLRTAESLTTGLQGDMRAP